MSIRFKILVGCLSLTLVTVLLGTFTQRSQQELGTVATRIYDEAFMAVSYLRSAQNGLMRLSVRYSNANADAAAADQVVASDEVRALLAEAVPDILADLEVARVRAMSPEGQNATTDLRARLETLGTTSGELSADTLFPVIGEIRAEFDTAVEIYAGDGYRFRRSVGTLIEESVRKTWIAMGLSVLIALIITYLLGRSIVPAVGEAVRIAKAIAGGQLDNDIVARGSGETVQMLRALAVMQASIAASLARIKALMAEQASNHAGEIAVQNGRFEAALNNMTQALCMFDASHRLVVFNRRFAEMFDTPEPGRASVELPIDAELKSLLAQTQGVASFLHDRPNGQVIAVSRQPTADNGWVATFEDVTERQKVEAKFAYMARHDALTGLPNRVLFREHMEEVLSRPRRDKDLAVLCVDLDGFKNVNDTLGHAMGDALLRAVAARLNECTRESELVARLGGDEFAVVQEEVSKPEEVAALARRLVAAMSVPFEIDAQHVIIGASVGIAMNTDVSEVAEDLANTLLKSADLALYRAKADGRGTYRFFEAEMDARLQARRRLELDLRGALEKGEFELAYQPLVNTEHHEVRGFEALLRWRHPERGLISPAEFIPVAEETGLIRSIGRWVLAEACASAASWPQDVKIAINLSPVQFRNNNLVADVSSALITSGLAASRLELEITESLLLQDNEAVLAILHQLRQLGVSIAMDDFGTGYSSLSYLQKFPFDKIKIDQSFVRDLSEKEDSVAIVRAVISLGQSLGMAVIAEGVETSEQLGILQTEGCWDVQGYLFSPPKPASHAVGLIETCAQKQLADNSMSDLETMPVSNDAQTTAIDVTGATGSRPSRSRKLRN